MALLGLKLRPSVPKPMILHLGYRGQTAEFFYQWFKGIEGVFKAAVCIEKRWACACLETECRRIASAAGLQGSCCCCQNARTRLQNAAPGDARASLPPPPPPRCRKRIVPRCCCCSRCRSACWRPSSVERAPRLHALPENGQSKRQTKSRRGRKKI